MPASIFRGLVGHERRAASAVLLGALVVLAASAPLRTAEAAGLLLTGWQAYSCATFGAGNPNSDQCNLTHTEVTVSQTAPGQAGPILLAPGISYADGSHSSAYQTPGGWNAADASVDYASDGERLGAGGRAQLELFASNVDALPATYPFHLLINGGGLTVAVEEFAVNGSRNPTAEIGVHLQAFTNNGLFGDNLADWKYTATLTANNTTDPVIFAPSVWDPFGVNPNQPNATVTRSGVFGVSQTAQVTFDPFVATIPLQAIPPGVSFTIIYSVWAKAYTGQHNFIVNPTLDQPYTQASAWIADPFGLQDTPVPTIFPDAGYELDGTSLASLTAVPAPAAAWLLLPAVASLARFVRRGRTRELPHSHSIVAGSSKSLFHRA